MKRGNRELSHKQTCMWKRVSTALVVSNVFRIRLGPAGEMAASLRHSDGQDLLL